jgi:intracellular sulfur oxidation DsrE/DsrF family protein
MLMGSAVIAGASAAANSVQAENNIVSPSSIKKEGEVACVYHTDFGDPARFNQMLRNIGNHYEAAGAGQLQLVIVAHASGVKFFMADLKGTPWEHEGPFEREFERICALAANGLRVYLCANTFKELKLDREKAQGASFLQFVPSGAAAAAALQARGFAYLKIG